MRYIRMYYVIRARRQGTFLSTNHHVELAFHNVSDLLLDMLVQGHHASLFQLNITKAHALAMGIITNDTGNELFGFEIFYQLHKSSKSLKGSNGPDAFGRDADQLRCVCI